MYRIRRQLFIVSVFAVSVVEVNLWANLVQAAPILLAELYDSRTAVHQSSTEGFLFQFHTGTSFENQVRFSRVPMPADIGLTFAADHSTVAKINSILTQGDHLIQVSFSGIHGAVAQVSTDEFFNGPFMGEIPTDHSPDNPALVMKAYIPQLGPGFSGYVITGVDMTIHGYGIDQPHGPGTFYRYWGAQTYGIFGERVPEPGSLLLVAIGLIGYAGLQIRSYSVLHRVGRMLDDKD
jgi:hypothetical protein